MINKYKLFLITVAIFQLAGCANTTLVYHTKEFSPQKIDVIVVLPVLDARLQAYLDDDFLKETEDIQEIIIEELEDKDFQVKLLSDASILNDIHPTQIPFLSTTEVRKIDLEGSNWLFVPVVTGLQTFTGTLFEYAEIVFYLFDTKSGKLVWEGSSTLDELDNATEELLDEFPDK